MEDHPTAALPKFYFHHKKFVTNQYWNLGIGFKARILIEYKDKILKKIDEK